MLRSHLYLWFLRQIRYFQLIRECGILSCWYSTRSEWKSLAHWRLLTKLVVYGLTSSLTPCNSLCCLHTNLGLLIWMMAALQFVEQPTTSFWSLTASNIDLYSLLTFCNIHAFLTTWTAYFNCRVADLLPLVTFSELWWWIQKSLDVWK